tara:strand:+ start:36 stop:599 length:564 start_codon:yes stop_codon:yes gene_type:complete
MDYSSRTIDVYDNVLEPHVWEFIQLSMKECRWKYDYYSHKKHPNKHWHIFCGHNPKEVVENGYEWVIPLWETAKIKYNFKDKYALDDFVRIYMNAHTYGIEPQPHTDDGDFTLLYYPRGDWQEEWGGGTIIAGDHVSYVGNRLVVFDAHLLHQAQPIVKECYELRSVIVIKANLSAGGVNRLDFYQN